MTPSLKKAEKMTNNEEILNEETQSLKLYGQAKYREVEEA